MSARTDWTGATFGGSKVLHILSVSKHRPSWFVRCGCGREFEATSGRLRAAQAHLDGRRIATAHVRCVPCTHDARAAAVRRRGHFLSRRAS